MKTSPRQPRPLVNSLDVYVAAVILSGAVAICTSLYALATTPPPSEWLLFTVLGLVAGACAVKIPGVSALISASDTFFVASAMLFGPAPAMLSLAVDSAALAWRRSHGLKRLLFNATAPSLSLWAATHVFQLLTGPQSPLSPSLPVTNVMLPLAAMTVVYFGLNSGLAAAAIALESRSPLGKVWRRLAPLAVGYVAAASAAFSLVIVMRSAGVLAAAAVIPLVLVFHLTLRSIVGRLEDAQAYVANVDRLYLSTIETLATAIEAKDGVTHDHIRRVQRFAVGLADALGIRDADQIKAIKAAALLHDTGKLAVPEYILNKPGKLTASEFEQMKLHVDVGADILSAIDFPYPVVPIVRAHHENWDGSGYPLGLKGDEIPIGARILSVVDCFDALTSDRPYRGALTGDAAMAIIQERRGTMYDPAVVDTFVTICAEIGAVAMDPVPHQSALARIGLATSAPAPQPVRVPVAEGGADAPEDLLAIVSLSRIVGGEATFGDAAALATSHLSRLLPDATCTFYVQDAAGGRLMARHATGPDAAAVRGFTIAVGERLTGWVAACKQTITNSDAALDLFDREVAPGLALSTPLMDGDRLVGVFTAYTAHGFTENQSRVVQMTAPHLGRILGAALRREAQRTSDVPEPRASAHDLRVVVSRLRTG